MSLSACKCGVFFLHFGLLTTLGVYCFEDCIRTIHSFVCLLAFVLFAKYQHMSIPRFRELLGVCVIVSNAKVQFVKVERSPLYRMCLMVICKNVSTIRWMNQAVHMVCWPLGQMSSKDDLETYDYCSLGSYALDLVVLLAFAREIMLDMGKHLILLRG